MPGPKGTITLPGPGGLIGGVIPRRGGSPAFSPTQVAGLSLWLDASDPSTLFQNSTLATPASADGDPVGGWKDKSGNARNALQATAGIRPALKTGIQNGKPVVRFNGTDTYLGVANNLVHGAAGCTVFMVIGFTVWAGKRPFGNTGGVDGLEVAVNCAPYARDWEGEQVPPGGVWLSDGGVVS